MLLSGWKALDSYELGTAGPSMLTNPLLILSFQPHSTENTWNDKEPAQVKVRHTVRALPGAGHKPL